MSVRYVKAWNGNAIHIGVDYPGATGWGSVQRPSRPHYLLCGGCVFPRDVVAYGRPTCKACIKQVERMARDAAKEQTP